MNINKHQIMSKVIKELKIIAIIVLLLASLIIIVDTIKKAAMVHSAMSAGLEECPVSPRNTEADTIWVKDCVGYLKTVDSL